MAVWQFVIEPLFPPIAFENDFRGEAVRWIDSYGSLMSIANVEEAETLVVGDSRIPAGIDVYALREHGITNAAALWVGEASLSRLLPAASTFNSPRMVVCISTLGLAPEIQGRKTAFNNGEAPPAGRAVSSTEYKAWRLRRTDELSDLGYTDGEVAGLFRYFERRYEQGLTRFSSGPRGIDSRLNAWFNNARFNTYRTVRPKPWAVSWFDDLDESKSDHIYQALADRKDAPGWDETRTVILDELIRLRASGCEVVCVRQPVSSSLLEIERGLVSDEEFRELCRDAGVPFLDYADEPYPTHDGLHMTHDSEVRFTKRLAADLLKTFAE